LTRASAARRRKRGRPPGDYGDDPDLFVAELAITLQASWDLSERRAIDLALAVHSRWAALPAKPMIHKTGTVLPDATTGKISYSNIFEFTDRKTPVAFSSAVVAAVLDLVPEAFAEAEEGVS
jgi:hypothetical protein